MPLTAAMTYRFDKLRLGELIEFTGSQLVRHVHDVTVVLFLHPHAKKAASKGQRLDNLAAGLLDRKRPSWQKRPA